MSQSPVEHEVIKNRPVTLSDVAKHAGVSKMAISAVVNGMNSTVKVSDATRLRIMKAVEELHYQPNQAARSMRAKSTGTVGFYYGSAFINTQDPFIREIFRHITYGLEGSGQDLLLYTGLYHEQRAEVVKRVLSNKIDAVIVLPSPEDVELLDALKRGHVPCVVIAESVNGLPCVTAADTDGSRAIAEYLLSKGHHRILYRRSAANIEFERLRYESFCTTINNAGGQVIASRAAEPMDSVTSREAEILLNRRGPDRVTAVACWRDYSAVRMLNYCRMNDIDVPNHLAVVGFDGVPISRVPVGTVLTTLDANWGSVVHEATELVANVSRSSIIPLKKTIVPGNILIGTTV